MSNAWAKFSTAIAWIALISGIIGGIVLATQLDWYFALIGILSGLVSFCLFGTLGFIADKVGTPKKPVENGGYYDIRIQGEEYNSEPDTNKDLNVFLDDQLLRSPRSDVSSFILHAVVSGGSHKLMLAREDNQLINTIKTFEIQSNSRIDFRYTIKKGSIEMTNFEVK